MSGVHIPKLRTLFATCGASGTASAATTHAHVTSARATGTRARRTMMVAPTIHAATMNMFAGRTISA